MENIKEITEKRNKIFELLISSITYIKIFLESNNIPGELDDMNLIKKLDYLVGNRISYSNI